MKFHGFQIKYEGQLLVIVNRCSSDFREEGTHFLINTTIPDTYMTFKKKG